MSHLEVERTYTSPDPEQALEVPDLAGVGPVAVVGRAETADLEAVYHDTADLRLVRAGISLRRRAGGADEGWHLKLPAGEGREEIHRPLGREGAPTPKVLRDVVLGWTAGDPLVPVATVTTRRTTRTLLDSAGTVLAEVADDHVTARAQQGVGGDETVRVWHEVEVELVDGDTDVLDVVEEHLLAHGLVPAAVGRKIERALGDALPEPVERKPAKKSKPAARVLHARLAEQLEELRRWESAVRLRRPDAVHQTRVAARRLRSALRTYGVLLDGDGEAAVAERLQRALQRMVRELGAERDTEVAAERITALLADADPGLVVGPVRRRLRSEVAARMRTHRRATLAELDSPAHRALLADLDRLVADPPWADDAARPAHEVLPTRLAKDAKRVARRLDAADDEESLHRARSAAKRLRYAAETLAPLWGSDATDVARTAKDLQKPLGTLQDTRLTRALLLEVAAAATAAGENAFTYGRLHALEELAASEAREQALGRWAGTKAKHLRL